MHTRARALTRVGDVLNALTLAPHELTDLPEHASDHLRGEVLCGAHLSTKMHDCASTRWVFLLELLVVAELARNRDPHYVLTKVRSRIRQERQACQEPSDRTEARSDSVSGVQTERVFVNQLCLPPMAQESKDVDCVELFVRNLAYDTTKQDLVDTFQEHGTITNMHPSTH